MKFAFIHAQLTTPQEAHSPWSATALCRILEVARSGYAAWQRRRRQLLSAQQQARHQAESCLRLQIRAAHRRGRCYGSQYCGAVFQKLLERSGTQPSMSGKGECLDNAVAESFFGTLKAELLGDQAGGRFASKTQATRLVRDYIDNFYNSIRRHSTLGHQCPIAFELAYQVNTQ